MTKRTYQRRIRRVGVVLAGIVFAGATATMGGLASAQNIPTSLNKPKQLIAKLGNASHNATNNQQQNNITP